MQNVLVVHSITTPLQFAKQCEENFPNFEWDFLQTLPPDGLTQDLTPNFEMDWKWCLKATSGSSDANCWGRGTCRKPALRGRSLGEGDEQLLQQAAHHPHHL